MKMLLKAAAFFLFFPLTLFGMSFKYDITVVNESSSSTSFVLAKGKEGAAVNTFLVVKRDDAGRWDYKHPAWSFELPPGSSNSLKKVTYGHVPDGYSETTKAETLKQGEQYLVVGTAPGSGGSVEFVAH